MAEDATPLADAVAAPKEFTVREKQVFLTPLGFRDFGQWDRWAKDEWLRSARGVENDAATESEKRRVWSQAMAVASKITLGSPKSFAFMLGVEGKLRIIWLSLRHAEKGPNGQPLTLDDVWDMGFADVKPRNDAFDSIMTISGIFPEGTEDANPTEMMELVAQLL